MDCVILMIFFPQSEFLHQSSNFLSTKNNVDVMTADSSKMCVYHTCASIQPYQDRRFKIHAECGEGVVAGWTIELVWCSEWGIEPQSW